MNTETYKRYADIKNQIKALETEAKEIQDEVVADMSANNVDKVESDFGTFFFTTRKTWSYPEYVKEAEATFKELKTKAETIGDAKFTESQSLAFRGKNETASIPG